MPEKSSQTGAIAVNRSARHEFFILEKYEAGMELKGSEVKSLRDGGLNLKEGYAHVSRGEMFLEGVHIQPYEHASFKLDPVRSRKLLMHRREIRRIEEEVRRKGLTLIPLQVYFKHGRAKVELGLAKGKKAFDKREAIKKREAERAMRRGAAR